jgi:hypothetical protein
MLARKRADCIRIRIQSRPRVVRAPQGQDQVVVEQCQACAGRQQRRPVPAAAAAEALGMRMRVAQQQTFRGVARSGHGLDHALDQLRRLGAPDVMHLAPGRARELAQGVALFVRVRRQRRIVEHDVAPAGAMAALVVGKRGKQPCQLFRTIAGADEYAAQIGRTARRRVRQSLDENAVGNQQSALDQAVEHPLDVLALAGEPGDGRLDARGMLFQAAEFAALVQRLQHLERHHVRIAAALDLEDAFLAGQRCNEAVFGSEQRRVRIDGQRRPDRSLGRVVDLVVEGCFHGIP